MDDCDEAEDAKGRDGHADRRDARRRKLAGRPREHGHHDRLDQHHETCFARGEAEHRLQVDGHQEADGKRRAVVDHGREVRQRELAVLHEDVDRQDGILCLHLMADKGDEQQEAEGQCHPAPGELRELGEAEHRKDHGQTVEQCATPIDTLHLLFMPLLMQVEPRHDDAGQAGRRDEDEDALPARIVVQEAAEHRAAGKAHVDHRDHPAERAPALLRREAQRDNRHVRRVEHRRCHALQRTRREQEAHVRRHDAES